MIEGRSTELLPFHWEVLGLARREKLGIEVRSAESRCEAPWIEGRSTKLFLFLGRDGGAQP